MITNQQNIFLELVRAGLWNKEVQLSMFGDIDWDAIYQLAEEQSVVGLVTAGLEQVKDVKIPQQVVLQFVGSTLQVEQRNKEMNDFVAKLIKRLRAASVYTLVVKGQGVAQCYEKPLWRTCGDVDLLLNNENYEKAKKELFPIAYDIQEENRVKKHLPMKIMGIDVELHGKMPFAVSRKAQQVNDEVVADSLNEGGASAWKVNETDVFIPNPNNHIYLVFTHFLQHFFIEGVGLRQICDWCRMLWTNRFELDLELLESRLRKAGLMNEWKVFGAMAVEYLGMPVDVMPFYNDNVNHKANLRKKAEKVLKRVLKSGNFGHNNDLSYRTRYKGAAYKVVSLWRRFWDFASLVPVFPVDAPKFFVGYLHGKM